MCRTAPDRGPGPRFVRMSTKFARKLDTLCGVQREMHPDMGAPRLAHSMLHLRRMTNVPPPYVLWALLAIGVLLAAVVWEVTKPVNHEPEDGTVSNEWRRSHAYRAGQKGSEL